MAMVVTVLHAMLMAPVLPVVATVMVIVHPVMAVAVAVEEVAAPCCDVNSNATVVVEAAVVVA